MMPTLSFLPTCCRLMFLAILVVGAMIQGSQGQESSDSSSFVNVKVTTCLNGTSPAIFLSEPLNNDALEGAQSLHKEMD